MSIRKGDLVGRSPITRREALKWGAAGAGALAFGGVASAFQTKSFDVHIRLFASPVEAQILAGPTTSIYQYTARLLKGPKGTLKSLPGSILGPIIRLKRGQRVKIEFVNGLAEPTVTHFHGLHVPFAADGHPLNTVAPGGSWSHEFTVMNRAGTYWYHAHTDMRTGFQVNKGLAGLLIVEEDTERWLKLPSGSNDIPVVIQDKRFSASNQILHSTGSQSGHLGNTILINGVAGAALSVGTTDYRLRFLNGCNARILKLAWSNGMPMTVLGTDGGLLESPVEHPYLMLGPGERRDVYVDCSGYPEGTVFQLVSEAFQKGGAGSGTPAQGSHMSLMNVSVDYAFASSPFLPSTLRPYTKWSKGDTVNQGNPRVFGLEYMGMWTINGNVFELNNYTNDEMIQLNQLELWQIRNDLPQGFEQPHPIHFHGPQFQIVERTGDLESAWYDTVREGFVDDGWHDTVLAFTGERVEIATKWTDYQGLFLYHCHNLEHEDMGMMRNLFVHA